MRSDIGGRLTVLGGGFYAGSVVRLIGAGVLPTTFVNAATLTADVPPGLDDGNYIIEVSNGACPALCASNPNLLLHIDPPPSSAPPATEAPTRFVRPLLTVVNYGTDPGVALQGKTYNLRLAIQNVGEDAAFNIVLNIPTGDFIPAGNAGLLTIQKLDPGASFTFNQTMLTKFGIGGGLKTLEPQLSYTDRNGGAYSDKLTLTIAVAGGGGGATFTPTPTLVPETPQMVVSGYYTDPPTLAPGTVFTLYLDIRNVGTANASRLSAVLGGAASSGSGDGTSTPGGVSGGGGDFATFGPIGSSNVKFISSVNMTETQTIDQQLIVNSTAKSGAYTAKVSLVYDDPKGARRVDDQVITLLVNQLPLLEISYYRPIDPAFAGQPWSAPVQVVNVGRNTSLLGNLEVVGPPGVDVQNGSIFVGQLEPGGQFPIDALVFPLEPGALSLMVNVHFIDDFNVQQVFSQTLEVEVQEAFVPEPVEPGGPDGEPFPPPATEETFFETLWRAFLGFIGLDSAPVTTEISPAPIDGGPIEGGEGVPFDSGPGKPIVVPIQP